MSPFCAAHAVAEDWAHAAKVCADALEKAGCKEAGAGNTLGFVYVTDLLAGDVRDVVNYLRRRTGVDTWIGTVGMGICGGDAETFERPAVAAMVASLPADGYCMFPSLTEGASQLDEAQREWIERTSPMLGLVHADPSHENLVDLIDDVAAGTSAFLVGGLTSSRAGFHQVAGRITGGGVSGVLFAGDVPVVTGLSQGCVPITETHEISDCVDNVLIGLDGRRALDVFKEDIGPELAADLQQVAGHIHAALPITGSDTGDYMVRNLLGIDPARGWLAISEMVEPGGRVMFVRRDAEAAAEDLEKMLVRLKGRLDGPPKGGVYVSCIARGPNLFGDAGTEVGMIRRILGDFPLVGFYANGEISFNRLYAYTGVLTLFA